MSRFEYLSVLISIVIALGISEVVSAWGALLRRRASVRFYWVHGAWTVFVLLQLIQFWWGFWNFRDVAHWSFPALVAVVAETLTLVLGALLITPRDLGVGELDLRAHYFEQSRLFFGLGIPLLIQLALVDALVGDQPFVHPENAVRAVGIAVAAWAACSRSERVHQALALVGLALLALFLSISVVR